MVSQGKETAEIRARVTAIARNSARIILTQHARKRMIARKITLQQIQRILAKEFRLAEAPGKNAAGDWCMTVQGKDSGMDIKIRLGIIEKAFRPEEIILVITVYEVKQTRVPR